MCSGLVGYWRMHQACLVCVCTRDILLECCFFLFLHLFDVRVIGRIVFDLTCASVFKNFAMARRVKEVFGTCEELKCRGIELNTVTYNVLLDACAFQASTPPSRTHGAKHVQSAFNPVVTITTTSKTCATYLKKGLPV